MDISGIMPAVDGVDEHGQTVRTAAYIPDVAHNTFGYTGYRVETPLPHETLSQKQQRFVRMVLQLLCFATASGFALTFGEALRTQAQANANAESGAGISNSLHLLKLAIDLQLFINDEYQTDAEAYRPLGDFWKSIGGSWGGDFVHLVDANHFSLEHMGVR